MSIFKKIFLFSVIALLINNYVYALDTTLLNIENLTDKKESKKIITLNDALTFSYLYNPELKAYPFEIKAKDAAMSQTRLRPNPELEAGLEGFGNKDLGEPEKVLKINQLMELGDKRSKRLKVITAEKELIKWDYRSKWLDVAAKTTKDFIEVLAMQERLILIKELVKISEQVLITVSERVKTGKVPPIEEIKSRAMLSIIKIELEQTKLSLESAKKGLISNWGNSSNNFEEVKEEINLIKEIPSFEKLLEMILNNPDIARWTTEIEYNQANIELETANGIADIALSGGIQQTDNTNTAFSFGISIPLRIFNKNHGKINEEKFNLAKTYEEKKAKEIQVRADLAIAYQEILSLANTANALKYEVLPAAQLVFDITEEGYKQGKFSFLEVLDAQRSLFEAKKQSIDILTLYHKAIADITRLTGKEIFTQNMEDFNYDKQKN